MKILDFLDLLVSVKSLLFLIISFKKRNEIIIEYIFIKK